MATLKVYDNRLVVWNSGGLPTTLLIEKLNGEHVSLPRNKVLAKIKLRPESRPESLEIRVLRILVVDEYSKAEISKKLGLKSISGQLKKVIRKLLEESKIEFTIVDIANSRLQKYRIVNNGRLFLDNQKQE